jgi:hypothetical protein
MGEQQYSVYKDGAPLGTVPANTTGFTDTSPLLGRALYCVEASNTCGTSAQSCMYVTHPCEPPSASWARTFSGAVFWDIEAPPEGGYAAVGNTLVRTNLEGEVVWERALGGQTGRALCRTSDGGFLVGGQTGTLAWLVRYTANGETIWTRVYDAAGTQGIGAVTTTGDGGFAASGENGSRLWLLKTDAAGDTIWTKTFNQVNAGGIVPRTGVAATSDGGFIASGGAWLVKTDSLGNETWSRNIPEITCVRVVEAPNGDFLTCGSPAPGVSRTDAAGDVLWTTTGIDAQDVVPASDGGAWVAGSFGGSFASLMRLDTDGELSAEYPQDYDNVQSAGAYALASTADGGFVLAGARNDGSKVQAQIIKVDCTEPSEVVSVPDEAPAPELHLALGTPTPNPVRSEMRYTVTLPWAMQVEIGIHDVAGRLVRKLVSQELPAGSHRLGWNRGDGAGRLGPGVYFLRLQAPAASQSRSFVILD